MKLIKPNSNTTAAALDTQWSTTPVGSVNCWWQTNKQTPIHHNTLGFSDDLSSQWVDDPAHTTQKDKKEHS